MAKIKRRGESGAAKNYITRNQAIKKLQISLSDFRRLCILKGIYPREPLNRKRANKGSSAPASFYYHKDIQYLLHEPLLVKFREHKTFAKKLARALGRGEWGLAKNLEEAKPVARLDHLVKERYPTFTLALQDLQDPLNLVHLFSTLPTNPVPGKTIVPSEVIQECGRLISEWKVWAIKTHSLRKVFLGIKGIYYECDVPGQGGESVPVRWLEGYEFQQHVPHDVDFRILLTFLELYRTLLSFIMYRLYTEENLVYPPPLDSELDERGESVGAFRLVEKNPAVGAAGTGMSKKEVKRAIRGIGQGQADEDEEMEESGIADEDAARKGDGADNDEDFVERPAKADAEVDDVAPGSLTTFNTILATAGPSKSQFQSLLFAPYTFYLSRETSSRTWEFVIRALGGRVVTAAQSPNLEGAIADGITHVIVDRPMGGERMREMEKGRKWAWVQPQWVADCVNRGRVLGSEEYAPGTLLPPHLSPWDGEGELARPWLEMDEARGVEMEGTNGHAEVVPGEDEQQDEDEGEEEDEVDDEDEDDEEEEEQKAVASVLTPPAKPAYPPALLAAAQDPSDTTLLHAAELEAETSGISHTAFRSQLKEATKALSTANAPAPNGPKSMGAKSAAEEDLRKIMMSNKKAKLYEKMRYGNRERAAEKEKLEAKRLAIEKRKRKNARVGKV